MIPLFLLVAVVLLGTALPLHAADIPPVVMNEVMWAKAEYIELFNESDDALSLNGWYLTRQKPPVSGADQPEETIITFGDEDVVGERGYFLIESSESATNIPAHKIKGSLGLVDGGVLLRLYAPEGEVVDTANQLGAWFAGENSAVGASMERTGGGGQVSGSWRTSTGSLGGRVGTPGGFNSEESVPVPDPTPEPTSEPTAEPSPDITPVVYSRDIRINEFLPDPAGDDASGEFIELINLGEESVDISLWVLDDVANAGSPPYVFPAGTLLEGGETLAFPRSQTKLSLNNDSDHVRLIFPSGEVRDDIAYSELGEGHSYNRVSSVYYEKSSTPTPNNPNTITTAPTPTPKGESVSDEEEEGDASYDYSSKIIINEVLPNPKGVDTENEFIELKSKDTTSINLFGWKLDDGEGGSSPYKFTKEDALGPGKILVLFRSKTNIALNNDTDTIRLINPSGNIISSLSYGSSPIEGQAYARTGDDVIMWTEKPTPGSENTIYIQEKVTPTPNPKATKKSTTPTAKKTSSSASRVGSASPRVLSAETSLLPWPGDQKNEEVSRSIVSSRPLGRLPRGKQGAFVWFGMMAAGVQLVSGISNKERIWQK